MDASVQFPKYDSYKNSSVEWIGKIPEHWNIEPFKALFKVSNERNGSNIIGEMLSVSGYRGIEIKEYAHEEQKRSAQDLADYRVVRKGQLVVNTMWLNYSGLGVSNHEGHVSPAYRAYDMKDGLVKRYIHYLLRSHAYVQGYTGLMQGIRPNSLQIKDNDFKNIPVVLPPHNEMCCIADFLDHKVTEIDTAIAKKQELIQLLNEQKAILINRAVTKGLNPDVKMKDSGVAWIGEIPEHWEVKRIKHFAKFYGGGTPHKETLDFWGGDIPWVSPKDMKKRYISTTSDFITEKALKRTTVKLLPKNVVLIVVRGMILARKIPVALTTRGVVINQDMKAMEVKGSVCVPEYFLMLLEGVNSEMSVLLDEAGHGTKTLPTDKLGNFQVAMPPNTEQEKILKYTQKHEEEYRKVYADILQQIEKLKEFKQTLITHTTTGKIKV